MYVSQPWSHAHMNAPNKMQVPIDAGEGATPPVLKLHPSTFPILQHPDPSEVRDGRLARRETSHRPRRRHLLRPTARQGGGSVASWQELEN
jgi:hypothetical protein